MTHFAALLEIRLLRKEIQQLRRQVLAARRSRDRWRLEASSAHEMLHRRKRKGAA